MNSTLFGFLLFLLGCIWLGETAIPSGGKARFYSGARALRLKRGDGFDFTNEGCFLTNKGEKICYPNVIADDYFYRPRFFFRK